MAAIHAAGWLHRDLKPANVVLRPDGSPVLVDFGAALPLGASATAESEVTDGYGAPEQYVTDAPEGPWTDVYGLGAIAYRALCGRAPLPAPARLRGEAMPLAMDHAGSRDEALCRAADWALAFDGRERPQTVEDWRAALSISVEHGASAEAAPAGAAGSSALEDYPPTVRVRRAPKAKIARPAAAAPANRAARSRKRGAGVVLAAVLLLAGAAAVAGAARYGRPLYERYVKTDWIVDPAGGGDTASIADAIARARDGATIAIRPGTYDERLEIERPVNLVAAVPEDAPLIAPGEGPCVVATGTGGSISGLRFAGAKAADPKTAAAPCLLLSNSSLHIEGNQITGGDGPAVLVRDGGAPAIAGNTIENGAGPGIVVAAGAAPRIAENTIKEMAQSALIVRGGAAPAIIDNSIEASGGLVFAEGATGTLEGNRISASRASGIEVTTGADPTVIDNTIEQAAGAGIFVYDQGRGRFERNFRPRQPAVRRGDRGGRRRAPVREHDPRQRGARRAGGRGRPRRARGQRGGREPRQRHRHRLGRRDRAERQRGERQRRAAAAGWAHAMRSGPAEDRPVRTLVIGRSPSADVVIADASLAPHHAELVITDDGRLYLTDCATDTADVGPERRPVRLRMAAGPPGLRAPQSAAAAGRSPVHGRRPGASEPRRAGGGRSRWRRLGRRSPASCARPRGA